MEDNKDELVVIKRSDLDWVLSKARMSGSAKIRIVEATFPASEVFEAANEKVDINMPLPSPPNKG